MTVGIKTELKAVERKGQWAVRIAWPNGTNHYFGKFHSRIEAVAWITDHRWMTATAIKDRNLLRGRPRRKAPRLAAGRVAGDSE